MSLNIFWVLVNFWNNNLSTLRIVPLNFLLLVFDQPKVDDLVKSREILFSVIQAKSEIRSLQIGAGTPGFTGMTIFLSRSHAPAWERIR